MKKYALLPCLGILFLMLSMPRINAEPQDNWYIVKRVVPADQSDFQHGIALGEGGKVYLPDRGNRRINTYSYDGDFLFSWGTNGSGDGEFEYPWSIAVGESNRVYVVDRSRRDIQAFDPAGNFLFKWSLTSTPGGGGFSDPVGIAASSNRIFVVDGFYKDIQVFDPQGTFIARWGESGLFDGQLNLPGDVAVAPDGLIHISELNPDSKLKIQVFDEHGNYIRKYGGIWEDQPFTGPGLHIGADGMTYLAKKVPGSAFVRDIPAIAIIDSTRGDVVREISKGFVTDEFNLEFYDVVTGGDGRIFATYASLDISGNAGFPGGFVIMDRGYRTMVTSNSAIPLPSVLKTVQRPGSPLVDIEYRVLDIDSPTLSTAVLGFKVRDITFPPDLSDIVPLNALVEGTSANVGTNISEGVVHRLTWDSSVDLSTNFMTFDTLVLANDGRDLLDFHFITIPSNGPNPELTMNASPVTHPEFLSVWYWLIATEDPAVVHSGDTLHGVGGNYDGQLLAQGSETTPEGRDFIFDRLNVRVATAQEVQYVKEASTPGRVNQFEPRNRIGDRPRKINEWGFDTGDYSANEWWAVPLP